jgi:iron-sulfur cluster assembly protein
VRVLLALTESAVQAVKGIVASSPERDETCGIRVVADHAAAQVNFQLSVVALPGEDDEVIEEHGARLFLDPEASSLLEDKVLDATVEKSRVEFALAEQAEAAE